jgi:outer membrane protein insertion porin family
MLSRSISCGALLLLLVAAAGCKEKGGVKVSSLKFTGTHAVTPSQLKAVLATAESDKLLGVELPWSTKRYFSREQFEMDLKRIVAFYKDRGYPDARVASFDAKLSADQTSVDVTLNISEGEPVRVERVVLEGVESLPDEHRQGFEDELPLKTGQPLDRALLQASREAVLDELKDHGHPYASVRVSEEQGSNERQRVIYFRAEPGPLAYHGEIEISGNSSVSDNVVRRQLTFRPGDLYRQSKLLESQRRLYALETFSFANVEGEHIETHPTEIRTRVTVVEGKHRKVNFGVGYGTEEKARGEIDWRHVNWFGGARTAGVYARYSSRDRGVRLNFKQPYLFSPRFSLGITGQQWHTTEPAFELDTIGGRFSIARQFSRAGARVLGSRPATTIAFTYANEQDDYKISPDALADLSFRPTLIRLGLDPRKGTGGGQRSAVSLDLGRNTTENILDARGGYVAAFHVEQAGRWLQGAYNYYEVTGEGRFYQSLGERAVIAVKARAGSIDGAGDQDANVPFFKRYFLGGATSLRGWGRFEVAPLSEEGLPIGGASFVDVSAELRVPIWRKLGGVLFVDGGNVWAEPWKFHAANLRYDAGPGLRYNTPIGPIRFDLGYQLKRIPGLVVDGTTEKRRLRLHFSIGQAF